MGGNGDICSRALFVENLHLKDDAQIKCAVTREVSVVHLRLHAPVRAWRYLEENVMIGCMVARAIAYTTAFGNLTEIYMLSLSTGMYLQHSADWNRYIRRRSETDHTTPLCASGMHPCVQMQGNLSHERRLEPCGKADLRLNAQTDGSACGPCMNTLRHRMALILFDRCGMPCYAVRHLYDVLVV
jgi:hypothetical protein